MSSIKEPMSDIHHPSHYSTGSIQPDTFIDDQSLNFRRGCVVKYVARAQHKGTELKDLKKAAWYLNEEIKKFEAKAGGKIEVEFNLKGASFDELKKAVSHGVKEGLAQDLKVTYTASSDDPDKVARVMAAKLKEEAGGDLGPCPIEGCDKTFPHIHPGPTGTGSPAVTAMVDRWPSPGDPICLTPDCDMREGHDGEHMREGPPSGEASKEEDPLHIVGAEDDPKLCGIHGCKREKDHAGRHQDGTTWLKGEPALMSDRPCTKYGRDAEGVDVRCVLNDAHEGECLFNPPKPKSIESAR